MDVFEKGQKVKVSGVSKGKGFQGTVKRHGFSRGPVTHGSHNVRAPGSIGASATPSRVFKGIRGPGQMGNKRVTQRGLEIVDVIADQNLLLVRGSVPGAKGSVVEIRTDAWPWPRSCPLHRRRPARSTSTRRSSARSSTWAWSTGPPRAELNARRHGTASTLTRGEVSMTTAKAFRQKGTGRARAGALSTPNRYGGGVAFGPKPRHYMVKVNRKARKKALRAALSVHADRGSLAVCDPARVRRRRRPRPRLTALGRLRRRAARSSSSAARTRTAPRASATSRASSVRRPTTSASPTSSAPRA